MTRSATFSTALVLLISGTGLAQVGGNVGFAQAGGRARAEQEERAKRTLTTQDLPPDKHSSYVEANVLMNVKADEFVAVFSVSREGETPEACARKMDDVLKAFTDAVKPLGVKDADLFVDFVAQNKIYGFEVAGDVAREKLVGFELKKNVSIRYADHALIDRLLAAAAKAEVFDLVKVDYVVKDVETVNDRLMDEASRVIKRKVDRDEKLLGIRLIPPAQVIAERSAAHYPTSLYDSYAAFESEAVSAPFDRQRIAVQSARKSRTFFYHGLDSSGFDRVVNPTVMEPPVQFTLYLKVKYEVQPPKAR